MGAETIDPYSSSPSSQEEEELQAFKYRMSKVVDWEEDLTE